MSTVSLAAPALNSRATTPSTGSTIAQPADAASIMICLAVVGEVVLAQRLADIVAARGEEGVGHAAADDQHVDLLHEVHEQIDLGRDLGAADDRHHRPRRIAEPLFQRVELGLHGPAGKGREMARQPFGRGVRAVRGGKSVVDEDVAILRRAVRRRPDRSFPRPCGSGCSRAAGCRRRQSWPRASAATGPMQSLAKATGRPMIRRRRRRSAPARIPARARPSAGRNAQAG